MSQEKLETKMTSYENDFTIIVHEASGRTKVYETHGALLAKHSDVFDAMLKNNFKESAERKVEIEDMDIKTFDTAIEPFVGNPFKSRAFDFEKAWKVFDVYDRYSFGDGLALCDELFASYINRMTFAWNCNNVSEVAGNLNQIIELAKRAQRRDFSCASGAVELLRKLFCGDAITQFIFSQEQIVSMIPLAREYPKELMPFGMTQELMDAMPADAFADMVFTKMSLKIERAAATCNREIRISLAPAGGFMKTFTITYSSKGKIIGNSPKILDRYAIKKVEEDFSFGPRASKYVLKLQVDSCSAYSDYSCHIQAESTSDIHIAPPEGWSFDESSSDVRASDVRGIFEGASFRLKYLIPPETKDDSSSSLPS